eukprot:TRINITY_DN18557_c0_g1_i1.p1 TRINITY_DN18557_c0_g1~~TRINITY_DN18557_c0_g1_i1.p1  ORF type:complete len:132 (-),score=38.49 TRINITY_DN18557_c0_g1_i1:109-468(-)
MSPGFFWEADICGAACSDLRRISLTLLVNLILFYTRYLANTLSSSNNFMLLRVQMEYQIKKLDMFGSISGLNSVNMLGSISSAQTTPPPPVPYPVSMQRKESLAEPLPPLVEEPEGRDD